MADGGDSYVPQEPRGGRTDPPAFNLPFVVMATCGVLILIHAALPFLPLAQQAEWRLLFAFTPARFEPGAALIYPGGTAAQIWTFVTYAFLHGDWVHLGFNVIWFVAFGSAVARRLSPALFLFLCLLCAIAGAGVHLLVHAGDSAFVIGASATVSGLMGAATRFIFSGPSFSLQPSLVAYLPLTPLRDRRIIFFTLVWLGVNLIFGILGFGIDGNVRTIAWEAHIGGYFCGLLLLPALERLNRLI